jgi:hypothetical protein
VCLVANECFEFVDLESFRDSCPRDILRSSVFGCRGQSLFNVANMAAEQATQVSQEVSQRVKGPGIAVLELRTLCIT